ncbi:MAG: DUF2877 domain-containing protein [Anaerolineae bacterium]
MHTRFSPYSPPHLNAQSVQEGGTGGEAELVGETAHRLLSNGFSGSVLAAVSKAVYLVDSAERVIWLGQSGRATGGSPLPAHPRAIHAPFAPNLFRVGMACRSDQERLWFDNGASVIWRNTPVWHPPSLPALAPITQVHAHAQQLSETLATLNCDESMAQALFTMLRLRQADQRVSPIILDALREVIDSCSRQDIAVVAQTGRALVGLGPGLTPSGDDFLGGLFFALYYLQAAYQDTRWDWQPVQSLLDWARTRTNLISYTLLTDHAQGQGVKPLHTLLIALFEGQAVHVAMEHAQQLITIGHTSGWDILAGAFTGMLTFGQNVGV